MTKPSWRSSLAAAAAAFLFVLPAHADPIIDFEDLLPSAFGNLETFITQGFEFTIEEFGIGVVDSAAGFAFANAPTNASGQFLASLNAGGLAMESEDDNPFSFASFDLAFISPFGQSAPAGAIVGQIFISAIGAGGSTFSEYIDLPAADLDGNFGFSTILASQLGADFSQPLSTLRLRSCIFDAAGACVFDDNLAQFAVDNIVIAAAVPEPGTLLLVALGIGLVGVARRRGLR